MRQFIGCCLCIEVEAKCPFYAEKKAIMQVVAHTAVTDFEGLDKDSIILLGQIRTIDKKCLREYLGYYVWCFLVSADKALAISTGLQKKD